MTSYFLDGDHDVISRLPAARWPAERV